MRKTLVYCWKILQLAWGANGYYAILSILGKIYESTLYPLILVLLLSHLLDLLGSGQHLIISQLSGLIIVFIISSFLRLIESSFLDTQQVFFEIKMANYINLQVDKKLTQLDPATFENSEFQNLLAQMVGVNDTIGANLLRITGFIDSILIFITATVVLVFAFPIFIPIILIATIPSFIAMSKYRIKVWRFFVEEQSLLIRVSQYIRNLLSQDSTSKEVAIYKTGDVLYNKVKNHQKTYTSKFAAASQSGLPRIISTRLIQFTAFLYTQALNLRAVLAGSLGVGQFALYFQQTQNLMLGVEGILDNYSSISMRNKYIEKYFEFINVARIIHSPQAPKDIPSRPTPPLIEFKNVSFKYPHSKKYVLKNFSLVINSGEKVALVGENGAGKTTLIKLVLRFYDVSEGEILINGVNIKEINLDKWYSSIGALFQDFIKYQFTFKENVFFGDQKKINNLELLKEATSKSGADKYIEELTHKYDQVVGKMFKGGLDLSGGQWQKLALARAFFKNAPILILDEPTSAIDAKAEYEIFQKVQSLQQDKTVIIISHRFSTVRNADRILVLSDGKITETGNHQQLMQ